MKRGFTLIEMLVVITIVGILIALAVPNLMKAKNTALEAQARANLATINHGLERYANDHYGYYPGYLWGGNDTSWCTIPGTARTTAFNIRQDCRISERIVPDSRLQYGATSTSWMILDPLIRYGYLREYPQNPFLPNTDAFCYVLQNDPRFGCSDFGQPSTMGNILPDPNFPSSPIGAVAAIPSQRMGMLYFAGDGYTQTADWLPGMLIYRSWSIKPQQPNCIGQPQPYQNPNFPDCESAAFGEHFLLGVYGSFYTAGRDIICDNPSNRDLRGLPCDDIAYGTIGRESGLPNKVMMDAWDPDMDGNINNDDCDEPPNGRVGDISDCDLDTFGTRGLSLGELTKTRRVVFGRPDGIQDGIILLLTSAEEK